MADVQQEGHWEVLPITGEVDLAGRDILIVDDAADSGSSMMAARSWVIGRGADPGRIRTAVLTATTAMGRSAVDYALSGDNCRFPWSSDSAEYAAFKREYEALGNSVTDLGEL